MHREPETDIFFSHSLPCFETGTLSDSAGLAGQQALGNSSHGISGARIAGAHCHAGLSTWMLGIQTKVLMHVQ